jgi:hypothetical protein
MASMRQVITRALPGFTFCSSQQQRRWQQQQQQQQQQVLSVLFISGT